MKRITLTALVALTILAACYGGDDGGESGNSSNSEQEVACLQNSGACLQMPLSSCVQLASIGAAQIVQGCPLSSSSNASSSSNLGSGSSSSIGSSLISSSSIGYSYSYGSVTYENQTYKTIKIGEQTWMAENLNYDTGDNKCYLNDPANCAIYGRLYNWVTAMALDESCNNKRCSDQVQLKHRGICPIGWHISTDDEWDILSNFVGGSYVAGKHLKALSEGGDDMYGFAALLGGSGYSAEFVNSGYSGSWWIANDNNNANNANFVNIWVVKRYTTDITWGSTAKSYFHSVRCIKDQH
jgi:uncharacterized protein (TIGR02145 family)